MDKESLLRLVDSLHRDKEIAKDVVFQGIESALTTAARKHFKSPEAISIQIDRHTGEIVAMDGDRKIDPSELGRITAQTAKQVIFKKYGKPSVTLYMKIIIAERVLSSVVRFKGSKALP